MPEVADKITGPLHWEQQGKSGRPMILIHPNPFDHSSWLYQMAHFSTWFRTIAIDLPGYGRSPTARPGVTMAQACWEAADEITDEPAILAGVSMGANVVLHMAHQRPASALALIVSGTAYHQGPKAFALDRGRRYSEQGIAFRREYAFEDFSAAFGAAPLGKHLVELFIERNDRVDVATIVELFRAISHPDPSWLHDPAAPTLIVAGSEDPAYRGAVALQARISGSELQTIQGAGHACNIEQPWAWDRFALDFLTKHGLMDRTAPLTG
jgi:pimeloyl-ACP methyl ester carboxylesterase